jgi:hypothetical protein
MHPSIRMFIQLGMLILVGILALACAAWISPQSNLARRVVEIGFLVAFFAVGLHGLWSLSTCACPACGRPFFRKGFRGNGLARRCLNCGEGWSVQPQPQGSATLGQTTARRGQN